jgi:hypothetical protein
MQQFKVDDLETVGGRYVTLFRLLGTITWPGDGRDAEERREYLIVRSTTAAVASPGNPIYEAAYEEFGGRAALLTSRPLALFEKEFPRMVKHWFTGDVMFRLLHRMAATPSVERPSVNKAAFILEKRRERFCVEAKNYIPKHVSDIIGRWGKVRPAAHLAAASSHVVGDIIREEVFKSHRDIGIWIQSLPAILGIAKTLGSWGTERGYLHRENVWQVPDTIPALPVAAEPLSTEELEFLGQYRAADRMA